jgi:hypothetical protein
MTSLQSARRFAVFRWKSTPLIAGVAGMLTLGGCGKSPEQTATPPAEATPEAASTPTSSKPSLVVQPPSNAKPKTVYVIEGFQAVSTDGTHDVPTGAAVNVVSEEGDEYVISYQGLSVRTPKAYFSETVIQETVTPAPTPVAAAPSPTPDTIPLSSDTTPVEPTTPSADSMTAATPIPVATPDPAMAADDAKAQELMGQIRSINDEIRSATDKMEVAPSAEKAQEAAKIEKLKKRRDALSGSLTEVAKP